jgi:hypothetical protein
MEKAPWPRFILAFIASVGLAWWVSKGLPL